MEGGGCVGCCTIAGLQDQPAARRCWRDDDRRRRTLTDEIEYESPLSPTSTFGTRATF
jgi:hypothetical protein